MRIRRPSALSDSTGRTCANAWRPALSRTTFLLRTPTELRKVRQLSWQQSRAHSRGYQAALAAPLPQTQFPFLRRPQSRPFQTRNVQFLVWSRPPLGARRGGAGGWGLTVRSGGWGWASALPGGAGRWDTPLPFFSSSAPPAAQSAVSSTSSVVLAVPKGRISDRERLALALRD